MNCQSPAKLKPSQSLARLCDNKLGHTSSTKPPIKVRIEPEPEVENKVEAENVVKAENVVEAENKVKAENKFEAENEVEPDDRT